MQNEDHAMHAKPMTNGLTMSIGAQPKPQQDQQITKGVLSQSEVLIGDF